jgi:hypothetical protein
MCKVRRPYPPLPTRTKPKAKRKHVAAVVVADAAVVAVRKNP